MGLESVNYSPGPVYWVWRGVAYTLLLKDSLVKNTRGERVYKTNGRVWWGLCQNINKKNKCIFYISIFLFYFGVYFQEPL